QAAPWGRGTPRWSVEGQPAFVPVSIAGLPGNRRCVRVGPPLSARLGSSSGSTPCRSEGSVRPQLPSIDRLKPPEVRSARQAGPLPLRAGPRSVLVSVVKPWDRVWAPKKAEFPKKVTFVSVATPKGRGELVPMARPPPENAELPLTVTFARKTVPPS